MPRGVKKSQFVSIGAHVSFTVGDFLVAFPDLLRCD